MSRKIIYLLLGLTAWTAGAGTVARMEPYHGAPAVMVNGEAVPPMTMTLLSRGIQGEARAAYMKKLGEAGIKVYYVTCATRWLQPGDAAKGVPDGVTAAVRGVRQILDSVPDARVMLRLNVSPLRDWVNAHPEEQLAYDDGSHREGAGSDLIASFCLMVSKGEGWDELYAAAKGELPVRVTVDEAVEWVNDLISRIDAAR